ncbi:MAG: ABC transporter ATP-binding protein [Brevinemataceae bacterium]
MSKLLIEVNNLKKYFPTPNGIVHAVDNISFSIPEGKTLGVVGESGCGKSTTGRLLLRLIEPDAGHILFEGQDILKLSHKDMRRMRRYMQLIFQDPYASLNPRMTVGETIAEPLIVNDFERRNSRILTEKIHKVMDTVGLARSLINSYPHELDGGRRQRVGIGRALVLQPKFIVCDEPVSSLDVSIQAQVLNLMQDLQEEFKLTYFFITHDLSIVKHFADEILVMYLGKVVEKAASEQLFASPKHPYTQALLSAIAIPSLNIPFERIKLKGEITSPIDPPLHCRFAPRCMYASQQCFQVDPPMESVGSNHICACIHHKNLISNEL